MKKHLFTFAALALCSLNTVAESYDVTKFWANGYEHDVALNRSSTPTGNGFTLSINTTTQVATFNFVSNSTHETSSCQAGAGILDEGNSTMAVYNAAVALHSNLLMAESFVVNTWGNVCSQLSSVVYRTDVKKVNVTCNNGTTYWGQSVYIVGSTARLGSWSVANAVKLNPTAYPTWNADVLVEPNTSIQWKCLKREELNPSQGVVWQSGSNNSFNSTSTSSVTAQF